MMRALHTRRGFGRGATGVYSAVLLGLFPLFTGLSGYAYLHLKKYLFFLAATLLWALALGVERVLRLLLRRAFPRPGFSDVCVLAFAVMAALATLLSRYGVVFSRVIGEYDSLVTYLAYCCILLGVSTYGADKRLCLIAFAVSHSLCSAVAVLQLCGVNALWLYPYDLNYYSPYVRETAAFLGSVGNVDLYSAYQCLALPLFAAVLAVSRSPRRWLLLLPLALGAVTLALSGVASGPVALAVTAVLLVPAMALNALNKKSLPVKWEGDFTKARRLFLLGPALLLALLAACYLLPFRTGTLFELHELLHGRAQPSFGSSRLLIWRECVEVFRAHPLLGIGPDTLENYLDIRFERDSELLGETLRSYVDNAHCAYLQLLVSFGALGCVPLSCLMAFTADGVLRALRRSATVRALLPPMLCYMIQALFNVGTCIIAPLFFFLWGLILYEIRADFDG